MIVIPEDEWRSLEKEARRAGLLIVAVLLLAIASLVWYGLAHAADDPRFCGPPARGDDGTILRSSTVLREFGLLYPKPQDGRAWYRDHVIPLACGGCDSVANLQWLPEAQWREKSKWERKVYGGRSISEGCP